MVALLQRQALGQQRTLVDHGAQVLRNGRAALLRNGDAGHMQVGAQLVLLGDVEADLVGLGAAQLACRNEGLAHALGVVRVHEGREIDQQPVMLGGLEGAVRHGVGLHHHVVLVHHQQGQGNAGKQGFEALGGAFGHGLAVVQHAVLDLQLALVVAQLGDQGLQRIVFGLEGGETFDGGQVGAGRQQGMQGQVLVVARLVGRVLAAHRVLALGKAASAAQILVARAWRPADGPGPGAGRAAVYARRPGRHKRPFGWQVLQLR